MCLKAEAGLKKGFLHPLKAELKLWRGLVSSEAGAGTGWNHGSLTSSTGNSDCSQCQLLFSCHFQPLGMTTLANTGLWGSSVVSKSRGCLFPSCSFSRRKHCTKMTPYSLTGGLVEGEFLSPYKLCTVKYIIYFL